MPDLSPREKRERDEMKAAEMAELVREAREKAVTQEEQIQTVEKEKKREQFRNHMAVMQKKMEHLKQAQAEAQRVLIQKKDEVSKEVAAKTRAEAEANDAKQGEQKVMVMRSVLEEAEQNVMDALKFVQAVKQGRGEQAYAFSYLKKENQDAQPPAGGWARLEGEQLNVPWLVKLNEALAQAKKLTDYRNMLKVQTLLDQAGTHVEAVEDRYKRIQRHKAQTKEALHKDAVQREIESKRKAEEELVAKKEGELKSKEANRKSEMAKLNARTKQLQKQADELEEKSYMKAAGNTTTTTPN